MQAIRQHPEQYYVNVHTESARKARSAGRCTPDIASPGLGAAHAQVQQSRRAHPSPG